MRAARLLIGAELRTVSRDTAGLVIPVALPMLILVGNALNVPSEALARYVLPIVIAVVTGTIGIVNVPSFLAVYRRTGVLRRLAVTPVHPAAVLVAQLVAGGLQVLAGVLLAGLVAVAGFGAAAPAGPLLTAAVLLLVTAAMFAVGLVVAALAPTANSAVAIGLAVFFGLGAAGGMFGPTARLPEAVVRTGEALPFGAAVRALGDAWTGAGAHPPSLISLAVCATLCTLLAIRFFRW
ncbi:ABC-2 type transport system permease protein [Catenuloplanes nepalensis]|uniref:ABC-2 type transport system permease protein n=1 Tax=Catenuloplanes nepalensis TaxID=587533 RepID=A0ABT9MQX4_9ACTN|nr:ABC transporter permease [Catenuloplanes nepalensis]MDP9793683.1 ABC-2 type transport system permease protein [Catenuloplanes nepalensis]